eukprot:evm.model.NODE_11708_length_39617_cov_40.337204.1
MVAFEEVRDQIELPDDAAAAGHGAGDGDVPHEGLAGLAAPEAQARVGGGRHFRLPLQRQPVLQLHLPLFRVHAVL